MASKNGKTKLSQFKPQVKNVNRGNQVGIRELDKSIRRDGYKPKALKHYHTQRANANKHTPIGLKGLGKRIGQNENKSC